MSKRLSGRSVTIESDDIGYDYKTVLYMRSNDGDKFSITYKISELAETGELNDENDDTLTIYLHADEFEGKKVTFNSYDYDPSLSFTGYVALWGENGGEQDYSGGEAELEKILIYGYGFKLNYIAIDGDGDFSDTAWKINVEEEDWDNEKEFKDDGHTYTTATSIDFKDSYIHITENPAANDPVPNYSGVYPSSIYGYFQFPYNYGYGQPSGYGYGLPYGYGPRFAWSLNGYSDIYSGLSYQYPLFHKEVYTMLQGKAKYIKNYLIATLILAAFILSGCGNGDNYLQIDNTKEGSLPHSMKGYELYSWQVENDWHFTLITGTNRLKSYEEITSDEDIIEDGWVKITVRKVGSIKTILGQLPKSEEVFWIDDTWLEQVQGETGDFLLPDIEIVDDIKLHCMQLGIDLYEKGETGDFIPPDIGIVDDIKIY